MRTWITEKFTFEAAHRIEGISKENARIHGHSHEVYVTISGEPDERYGWVIPHEEFQTKVRPIVRQLDHTYLNEFIKNPTAEMIARHLWLKLMDHKFSDRITLESVKVCKVGMCAEVKK